MKSRLNGVKAELSDKDIKTWHSHTSNTNPAGELISFMLNLVESPMVRKKPKVFDICGEKPNPKDKETIHLDKSPSFFFSDCGKKTHTF